MGEHLVNIKKNGRHIPSSPFAVMISQSEIGDASRVRVSGQGLSEAKTFEQAEFIIDTRDAGKAPSHTLSPKDASTFTLNILHPCSLKGTAA